MVFPRGMCADNTCGDTCMRDSNFRVKFNVPCYIMWPAPFSSSSVCIGCPCMLSREAFTCNVVCRRKHCSLSCCRQLTRTFSPKTQARIIGAQKMADLVICIRGQELPHRYRAQELSLSCHLLLDRAEPICNN
jgi:hypothetical protein